MSRRAILTGVLAILVAVGLCAGCGSEESQQPPGIQEGVPSVAEEPITQQEPAGEAGGIAETTVEETSEEQRCPEERTESGEIRIGDFAAPEGVPSYEILEEKQVEKDCTRVIRLLVDTRSTSEADYTLIAQDLKSWYEELDAVSVEFTDTAGTFSYNGAAVIFNTKRGARFVGYIHHPPRNEGYYVSAAKD